MQQQAALLVNDSVGSGGSGRRDFIGREERRGCERGRRKHAATLLVLHTTSECCTLTAYPPKATAIPYRLCVLYLSGFCSLVCK